MKISKTLWYTAIALVSASFSLFLTAAIFDVAYFKAYVSIGGTSLAVCVWLLLVNIFEVDRKKKGLEK